MRRSDRELTGLKEIEEIIAKADVCRIALANNNIPYVVKMNFGYKRFLFFHCANEGRKLDMIRQNDYVCFEMDTDHELYAGKMSCDWGMRFSSVVGYGNISILSDRQERMMALNSIMEHYGASGEYSYNENLFEHTTLLRLKILEMTGKKK
jgi:uncharacterized protein